MSKWTSAVLALAVGCTESRELGLEGTQSLTVELVAPANPGTIDDRLTEPGERTLVVNLTARGVDNAIDATFSKTLRVYAQFLGTVTPELHEAPLAEIAMTNGVAMNQTITLPPSVLGPTTLWIDDGQGLGDEYVHGKIAGSSPTLWYPDPFIRDLQTPRSETALDALIATPLQDKQIAVRASRHGAVGRLVITSVFSQGYTVSDVRCADEAGTPPCTADRYDHVLVFTFSAGRGSDGHVLERGETIDGFAGGLSEFNGLSEIGFPQTFTPEFEDGNGDGVNDAVVAARQAAPALVEDSWFAGLDDPNGMINFERNEAGPIEIRGAQVCPLDQDFERFKQWKLAVPVPGQPPNCANRSRHINVITAGVVASLDPAALEGRILPRVVGILRPVNFAGFNVWIIFPRDAGDLTLQ